MCITSRLLTILILIWLTGCVAAVAGGAAAGGYYIGKDERTAGQIARDARITASVKTALVREDGIKALDINVDTHSNQVTLHGRVATEDEESLAVRIAESIKGVEGVTSNLNVVPVEVEELD